MGKYWGKTILYVAAFLLVAIIGGVIASVFRSWFSYIVFGIVVFVSLMLLVRWHTRTFAYLCAVCGHEFEISIWKDLLSPHGVDKQGGWKYLRCPSCGRWMKARLIPKAHLRGM